MPNLPESDSFSTPESEEERMRTLHQWVLWRTSVNNSAATNLVESSDGVWDFPLPTGISQRTIEHIDLQRKLGVLDGGKKTTLCSQPYYMFGIPRILPPSFGKSPTNGHHADFDVPPSLAEEHLEVLNGVQSGYVTTCYVSGDTDDSITDFRQKPKKGGILKNGRKNGYYPVENGVSIGGFQNGGMHHQMDITPNGSTDTTRTDSDSSPVPYPHNGYGNGYDNNDYDTLNVRIRRPKRDAGTQTIDRAGGRNIKLFDPLNKEEETAVERGRSLGSRFGRSRGKSLDRGRTGKKAAFVEQRGRSVSPRRFHTIENKNGGVNGAVPNGNLNKNSHVYDSMYDGNTSDSRSLDTDGAPFYEPKPDYEKKKKNFFTVLKPSRRKKK